MGDEVITVRGDPFDRDILPIEKFVVSQLMQKGEGVLRRPSARRSGSHGQFVLHPFNAAGLLRELLGGRDSFG